ncbi:MAG: 3-phosphoshikimate 1-carboxyvinyltransferase, partial [Marinirhabdus sp.]
MTIGLRPKNTSQKAKIKITGSKSETNRLLILQALFPQLSIAGPSNSDDSAVLAQALKTSKKTVNVHHAGTAMRFLTAYFALKENTQKTLTGSQRMQQRPIGILVAALR